jgi:hypothetical protein
LSNPKLNWAGRSNMSLSQLLSKLLAIAGDPNPKDRPF